MATTMNSFSCHDCGLEVASHYNGVNLVTCRCGQSYNITDPAHPKKINAYVILNAGDLIQPGTKGVWKDRHFEVTGRFRCWFQESVWNYWSIIFEDGSFGYLGEGYGMYAIYTAMSNFYGWAGSNYYDAKPGKTLQLTAEMVGILERTNKTSRWEMEGEPWMPQADFSFQTYDLSHESGFHAEVFEFERQSFTPFQVQFTILEDLQLKQTRESAAAIKEITCPQCKTTNKLTGFPFSQSFACTYCEKRYFLDQGLTLQKIGNDTPPRNAKNMALSPGTKGTIRGIEYEVIGYTLKAEKQSSAMWKEYTLFNREQGFAFLSEYDGHWIFLRETGDAPHLPKRISEFEFNGEPFQLYNSYSYHIREAVGVFPGNIFNDHKKQVWEYISPPEMWSKESNEDEGDSWFYGQHISGKELATAFNNNIVLPYTKGVGAVQPKGFINLIDLVKVTIAAVLVLLAVHLLTISTKSNKVILEEQLDIPDSVTSVTRVYGPYQLDNRGGNLEFNVSAPVYNNWLELNAVLVNKKTGEEYAVSEGVEYYQGYEDGESWSEGSRQKDVYLNQIPKGEYHLQITGQRSSTRVSSADTEPSYFTVRAIYDVPNHSNLFLFAGIIIVVAIGWYQYVNWTEQSRWSNSPFSPFDEDE